jgi:hypothetical protein
MSKTNYVIVVRLKSDNTVYATRFSNNVNQRIRRMQDSILGNNSDTELHEQFAHRDRSDIEFVVAPVSRTLDW